VDEDTFLRFLQNFENAQQASPWLKAVYVAGSVVGFIPGHITLAVSISVQIAAGYVTLLSSRTLADPDPQYCDRVTESIQSQQLPGSDEQRCLHATWTIRHGPDVQGRTQ
jgi:hypothetical protein